MLASQFGYLFAVLAAAGLCWGTCLRDRRSLLAVWGWMSLLPLTLLADWNRIGYAVSYFNEVSLVSGCLAALLMADVFRRLGGHLGLRVMVAAFSLLAICHMTVASIDAALYDGKLAKFTGVHAGWGSVKPDNGIKAAGWYVRQHVPSDAIVMATHANRGLEVSVAEYYLGRSVLAYCDLQPWMNPPLMKAMQSRVDVFVIEPREIPVVESLPDFEEVATFHCKGIPVRHVYARRTLNLPKIDAPASELAARYNHQYQSYQVPQTIATAPGFDACLAEYLAVVRKLRS